MYSRRRSQERTATFAPLTRCAGESRRLCVYRLLALCLLLLTGGQAKAGVGNFCPIGPCVFDHPTIINVYVDSSPTQWDTDVGGAASGETQAAVEAFTAALVHSSYISQLSQYGVSSIAMLPGITLSSCGTMPANVDDAINNVDALILCALTNSEVPSSDQVIVNFLLPPQIMNTGFCNKQADGSQAVALHGHSETYASPLWTIIPTTTACLGSAAAMFSAMTHEVVEAATDPDPQALSGWKEVAGREIGDFCATKTSPLVFGSAQLYWSNSASMCVSGFASATAPAVTSSIVCGTGRDMQFTFNGTFGPTPWDLRSNQFAGQTLYVSASITSASTWSASNSSGTPQDPLGFRKVTWVQGGGPGGSDQIRVTGFSNAYGTLGRIVRPGDAIRFTIENPDNGARATVSVTAPSATQINALAAAPDLTAGATGGISGVADDGAGCAVEGSPVTLTASAGTLSSQPVTTDSGGRFTATFEAPFVSGVVTITAGPMASTTTRVHPRLDSLVQPRGDVAGAQPTLLSGLGFDASTIVSFGPNTGTLQSVSADHKTATIRTPASTLAVGTGRVPVGVTVHSVGSYGLTYDYIQPDLPAMEFLGGTGLSCKTGQIKVSLFNAAGELESGSIALSATYPAFVVNMQPVANQTVTSGSTVTIEGGGPITATNVQSPNNSDSQSFPVWPQDLCDLVKAVNAKVSHIVAGKKQLFQAFDSGCSGDCGPPGLQRVIWADAPEVRNSRNLVSMQARNAVAQSRVYRIESLDEAEQQQLVAENPIVAAPVKSIAAATAKFALGARAKSVITATFVGAMIRIARVDGGKEALSDGTRVSFALPSSPVGEYAIMHLHRVGEQQAWISERPSSLDRERGVVTATVISLGTYALVQFSTPAAEHAGLSAAASKQE